LYLYAYLYEGDTVEICTTAEESEIDAALDVDFLFTDGVYNDFDASVFTEVPAIPEGHKVLTLWWD